VIFSTCIAYSIQNRFKSALNKIAIDRLWLRNGEWPFCIVLYSTYPETEAETEPYRGKTSEPFHDIPL
jgi:hypothetical protein